eukprot:CAMPEP_0168174810 /NCGR_PEP_ID=MMETSP0139_2-20121125/6735_1 /TAXON_ID=44445 /ORGANISM="Pseudo-nitzschia australis, Strain 10249 10 AB" /LENGTH=382 /DNA_ID=CAMNT_0008093051 /DNA_START=99 /DNA_END=1247 /DNA_ORIENTATION=+
MGMRPIQSSKPLQRAAVSALLLFSGNKVLSFSSDHQHFRGSGNSSIHKANHRTTATASTTSSRRTGSSSSLAMLAGTSPPSSDQRKQALEQLDEARALISGAISIGAPAYNAGDIAGCARVYRETAAEIAALPGLPPNAVTGLRETLRDASTAGENDNDAGAKAANEEAWAFRKQFDAIIDYQFPFVPTTPPATGATLEPFVAGTTIPAEPYVINDNVMGGVSRGEWNSGTKTFGGTTSLANNGGFSSLRWRYAGNGNGAAQNWSYAKGIYLKNANHSNPDRHTFRLILKDTTCERVRGANFKVVFCNPSTNHNISDGDDSKDDPTIFVPFESFDRMEQMGRALGGTPAFNRGAVTELGLMAIKPTVVGDFELTIEEWGLYY